jgi:nucleoside-diphosphate-sugar epimerase
MRSRRTAGRLAVTGASGPLGRALLDELTARPPTQDADLLPVHDLPTDAASAAELLAGARTVVHLAPTRDPAAPTALRAVDLAATRALLEAARPAGVQRMVLVSSTDVHRARPGSVPLPETAPVAAPAGDSLQGTWVETERLAGHARRTGLDVVVLRPAALVGLGPAGDGTLLRSLAAPRLLAVRGVEPLWQLCHVDDLVAALALAAAGTVRGSCAVACEGWLTQAEVERLSGRRRLELPAAIALSTAERLHRLGAAPGPAEELHALLAPVVVQPGRLLAAGWRPAWTNEQALLAYLRAVPEPVGPGLDRTAAYAAGTAGATAAVLGTAALVRRARRRRRR